MRKFYVALLLLFSCFFKSYAQNVSSYTFSQSNGAYSAITGGTLIKNTSTTSIDDDTYTNLDIGFTFSYAGVSSTGGRELQAVQKSLRDNADVAL